MENILVVEDDWELNRGICLQLQKEGYGSASAHAFWEAQDLLFKGNFQLVLLDVNLPDQEGFDLPRWMKKQNLSVPVIFLTARDLEEDALRGYDSGAMDYVTKPFSSKILMKKIAVILRHDMDMPEADFKDGYLYVCLAQGKVQINGQTCTVTPTEFRILSAFLHGKNQLLTYDMLLQKLWERGNQIVDKHALAVNIARLRSKLEDETHKYIGNVYGMGYQWIG